MVQIQNLLDTNQAALDSIPWDNLAGAWIGAGFTKGFGNLTELPPYVMQLSKLWYLRALLESRGA